MQFDKSNIKKFIHFSSIVKSSPRSISVILGLVKLFRGIGSLYVVILSAKYFGASIERDAWVVGLSVLGIFAQVIFGPINESFRAKYTHLREEIGDDEANKNVSALFVIVFLVSIFIGSFIYFFSFEISKTFAPSYSISNLNKISTMIKVLLPTFFMSELSIIGAAMLNSYRSYYLPDIYGFVSVIINVVILIVLVPFFGIYSLVISNYFALLGLLFFTFYYLGRYGFEFYLSELINAKQFFVFAAPFYILYAVGQVHLYSEKLFAAESGVGSISILDYGRKLFDMPMSIVTVVVATVLTPILSLSYSRNDKTTVFETTFNYTQLAIFLILPLQVTFSLNGDDLVLLLLSNTQLNQDQLKLLVRVLNMFGFAAIGMCLYSIYGQAMIAQKRVKEYSLISAGYWLGCIALYFLSYHNYGIMGIVFSWTITTIFLGINLCYKFYLNNISIFFNLIRTFLITQGIFVTVSGIEYLINFSTLLNELTPKIHGLILIIINILITVLLSILSIFCFGIKDNFAIKRL